MALVAEWGFRSEKRAKPRQTKNFKNKAKAIQSGLQSATGQKCLFFSCSGGGLVVSWIFRKRWACEGDCFLGVLMKVFPRAERTEMITRLFIFVGAVALSAAVSLADSHALNVGGVWEATMTRPNGETADSTLTIQKKDGKWSGTVVSSQGEERKLDRVSFEEKSLRIEVDVERENWSGVIGVKAKLSAKGVLKGNWYAKEDGDDNQSASGDWKAVRSLKAALAGTWNVVAKTDEEDFDHQVVFSESSSGFSAIAHRGEESKEFAKVTVEKNKLLLELPFDEAMVKVKAFQRTAKKIVGEWTLFDDLGSTTDSGKWVATK